MYWRRPPQADLRTRTKSSHAIAHALPAVASGPTGVMLLNRWQPDSPAAARNKSALFAPGTEFTQNWGLPPRVAHCIDNGPMEGFWGILKRERYYGRRFTSKESLIQMIQNYITYYNTKLVQHNLGVQIGRAHV